MDYPGFDKRQEDRYNAVRYLLADHRGRYFLQMLMDECGVYNSTYAGDVNDMLVSEGMRRVGLWAREVAMQHDPDIYVRLVKEHKEREAHYAELDQQDEEILI